LVIFDKGNWLLKELEFKKTKEEWGLQAEAAEDPVDRIRAIKEMALMEHNEAFASAIARAAVHDRFWAVRREAVNALALVDDSLAETRSTVRNALLEAAEDTKASVRAAAMAQLRELHGTDVAARVHAALRDSSYAVVASALRALPRVDSSNAVLILSRYLDSTSYQNAVSSAALHALRDADSTIALREAIARLRYGAPAPVRMTALGLVTRSIRSGSTSPDILIPLLRDKSVHMRNATIRLLGNVGKDDVISSLERLAADPDNPSAEIARQSIERIRSRSHH
jgi:HEAT repeat protein